MDWDKNFFTIVKETKDNLAKAKEKLRPKPLDSTGDILIDLQTESILSQHLQDSFTSLPLQTTQYPDMSTDQDRLLSFLQEQINAQNKTIEKIQKLVVSVNTEKDYYREQVAHLRDEVDRLTERVNSQLDQASSERKISALRREMMREIENVKSMMQMYSQEISNTRRTTLSSTWNDEIWTLRESLMNSLEQVRREIKEINQRADRIETQLASELTERSRLPAVRSVTDLTEKQKPAVVYTPLYRSPEDIHSKELLQIRQTIGSLSSKLSGLERKLDLGKFQPAPVSDPLSSVHFKLSKKPAAARSSYLHSNRRSDVLSLSDLSDVSDSSDGSSDDINPRSVNLSPNLSFPTRRRRRRTNSSYESSFTINGKGVSDLSDHQLGDSSLDSDSLGLDS